MKKLLLSIAAFALLACGANGQTVVQNLYQLRDTKNVRTATDGQALVWSAAQGKWIPATVGASASAGGSNTQLQYNNGGALAGSSGFTVSSGTNFTTHLGRFNELRVKGTGLYVHRTNDTFGTYFGLGSGAVSASTGTNDTVIRYDLGDLYFVDAAGTPNFYQARTTGNITNRGTITAPQGVIAPITGTIGAGSAASGAFTTLSTEGNATIGNENSDSHQVNGTLAVSQAVTLSGDLAVNGDDITSDGNLTVTPAGTDLLVSADDNYFGLPNVTSEIFVHGTNTLASRLNLTTTDTTVGWTLERNGNALGQALRIGRLESGNTAIHVSTNGNVMIGAFAAASTAFEVTGTATVGNGATSSGVLRINEDTDAGSNYASFQVPSLAANTVYTLPPDDGDAGEQLQTDGSGNLTWEAAGSGVGEASPWADADPVVLDTTTRDVVIGAAAINSAKLSIDGDADQVQLAIQGHSTQTTNPIELENSAGTVVFSVANNGAVTSAGSASFGSGNGQLDLGAAGVRITSNGDGALTLLGLGDGFDESITLNLDDTANTVVISTSTGVTAFDFGAIGVDLDSATATLSTVAGAIDAGGATSLEIPNGAAPTTDAFGEIAGDNNAWAASRGAAQFFDGTANTWLVGVLSSDTPSNGQVPKFNTGGTITWEDDSGAMASDTLWDAAGDLVYASAADTGARLAIGTAGQFLQVNAGATAPQWSSFSGDATVATGGAITLASGITRDTEWDTEAEVQTAWGSVNVLLETEIDASSELRALMDDESGTGALIFADGAIGAATATTPSSGDSDTSVATSAFVDNAIDFLYIDAGAFIANTTSGALATTTRLATLDAMEDSFDFDPGTDEFINVWFLLPDCYTGGDIGVTIYWTGATAGDATDDVIWACGARSFANDDARGTATTFDDTVTDTLLATNDEHVTSPMTGVTIQGTPAAGERCVLKISRDANAVGDNYNGDAKFLGVRIDF